MHHRWGKDRRILKSAEVKHIQSTGKSWRCKHFIVKRIESISPRVAFTVSKKVGSAPIRNKVKRLLREILRKKRLPEMDLVFIVYRQAGLATLKDFEKDIDRFLLDVEAQLSRNR